MASLKDAFYYVGNIDNNIFGISTKVTAKQCSVATFVKV